MSSSFWTVVEARPDDLALVGTDGGQFTFAETAEMAGRVATVLATAGVRRGDTVSMVGVNEPLWMITYLAALQSGLYFTPLSPSMPASDLVRIWKDCKARAVVAGTGQPSWLAAAAAEAGIEADRCFDLTGVDPSRSMQAAMSELPDDATPPPRTGGVRALYTGGTTGAPKCVRRPLPDGAPEDEAGKITRLPLMLGMREGQSRHLVAGPLHHGGPLAYATAALHLGATLILAPKWSAGATLPMIEKYRVNSTFMVPTMLSRLLSLTEQERKAYDLTSLEAVIHGAAPCPAPLKRRLIEWLGPVLYEFYAATEGGGTHVTSAQWLEHPGSVGRPFPARRSASSTKKESTSPPAPSDES